MVINTFCMEKINSFDFTPNIILFQGMYSTIHLLKRNNNIEDDIPLPKETPEGVTTLNKLEVNLLLILGTHLVQSF